LVIKEKTIVSPWEEYTFNAYQKLVEAWGSDADFRNCNYSDYVVMFVDDYNRIYVGEYTDAQGFSSVWGFGEMIVHQIYHRWNGWACGIKLELKPNEHQGLWAEGFNEFYCNKILTELDLTKPNQYMKGWYQYYKSIYGTRKDATIVYFNPNKHDGYLPNGKGAVIVYYMDKKLREITNGKYSMDDVLKYFLLGWKERNQPFSYERMLKYLEQIGGSEYAEEVRQIIYENKRVVLTEFE
jgi:predicted metalloprotease with PDZ domain